MRQKSHKKLLDKQTVQTVIQVMTDVERTRDGGMSLVLHVWSRQMPELLPQLKQISNAFRLGALSKPSSIDRARRKVEEEIPTLRGTTYDKRQSRAKRVSKEMTGRDGKPTDSIREQVNIRFEDISTT